MCVRVVSGGVTKSRDDRASSQNTCHATVIKEQTFQWKHLCLFWVLPRLLSLAHICLWQDQGKRNRRRKSTLRFKPCVLSVRWSEHKCDNVWYFLLCLSDMWTQEFQYNFKSSVVESSVNFPSLKKKIIILLTDSNAALIKVSKNVVVQLVLLWNLELRRHFRWKWFNNSYFQGWSTWLQSCCCCCCCLHTYFWSCGSFTSANLT